MVIPQLSSLTTVHFPIMSLKRNRSSDGPQVYDIHPNTLTYTSEENEITERKKRRTESFDQQVTSKGQKCSSSSEISQKTSAVIGQKRKSGSHGTSVCDTIRSTNTTSGGVDEEDEIPVKKRRESSSTLHKKICVVSEKSCEDQQVQPPPAPVQQNITVDLTADSNILSRYRIGKLLGEGGTGRVYRGKRLEDGLKVAVKITDKMEGMESIVVPGHPEPLPLEIALMLMVNTEPKLPEIIQLLDWQDEPDRYIMILERPMPCQDLLDFISCRDEPLQEDVARIIMLQATRAARFCCRRGVFHGDIKMGNLLVNTETLEVKLIDFGYSQLLSECDQVWQFVATDPLCPPEFTRTGVFHGKPTTVWSLGILLFNMVCGCDPEPEDRQMMDEGVWSWSGLSNECCDLIQALLCKYSRQRMDLKNILRHEWFKIKN